MVLSDRTIRRLLDEGRIEIEPYDGSLLQPSSVDVRVDRYFRVFHNARYPYIEFVSEPHPDDLVRNGGRMRGRLSMHGISRVESFHLSAPACDAPGKDCDVVASGSISRDDYGLDGWQFALMDRVRFNLRVRLVEAMP